MAQRYYYRCRWIDGRPRRVYLGAGAAGEAAALAHDLRRLEREKQRRAWQEAEAARAAAFAPLLELCRLTDVTTRAALLAAGFHQHHRQWRRTMNQPQHPSAKCTPAGPPAAPPRTRQEVLEDLAGRAQRGDESALPELRTFLDADPGLWREYGDLSRQAERSLINLAAGDNLLFRESLMRKAEDMRRELAGPSPTPLERLAVARVVACWLQTAYFDAQQAQARALGPTQARVLVQLHESANHRYLAAIKTLAMLRKLLPARPARPTVPDAARFTGGHNDAETLVKGVALLN
jgi:hypothetical protein